MIAKLLAAILFIAPPVESSIRHMQVGPNGQCTAFSINAVKAIWASASHCWAVDDDDKPMDMFVGDDLRVMRLLYLDKDTDDGMVIFATDPRTGAGVPALKLGKAPKRGDTITQYGYGQGVALLLFKGLVQFSDITGAISSTPVMLTNAYGMEGMSGGPILDKDGHVVSLILGGFQTGSWDILSYGVSYPHFKEVLDKYSK